MKYYAVSDYYECFEKYSRKFNRDFDSMIIEICDDDLPEVRKLFSQCLNDEIKGYYEKYGITFWGNKSGAFQITPNEIIKDEDVRISYKEIMSMYKCRCKVAKGTLKTEKQAKKSLCKNKDAKIHKLFTISSFKRYVYTGEKFNMAFRLKKCKSENQPIVLYFHSGGNGGNSRKALEEFYLPYLKMLNRKCTIIIPQLPNDVVFEDYIAGIKEVIEIIAKEVKADNNRIYAFGGSAGGRCTWQLAFDYPDFLACALPISGEINAMNENKNIDLSHMKRFPIWVTHSADDCILPIDHDDYAVKKLQEMGAPVKYTRYEKYGHGLKVVYNFYLREKWVDWMFDQSLEKR